MSCPIAWAEQDPEELQMQGLGLPGPQDREGWRHLSPVVLGHGVLQCQPAHKQEWLTTLGRPCVHWLKFILAFSARCELGSNNSHYPRVEASAG